jgi:hypothetical protein
MDKALTWVGAMGLLVALAASFAAPLCATHTRLEFTADDEYYVAFNPRVLEGQFKAIWTTPMRVEFFPVTLTTFAAEYRLWKGDVGLFHLVDILLFCGIGVLSCLVACELAGAGGEPGANRRITGVAVAVTGLAMMHPANAEAVSSISNQKELLYVLFSLLALKSCLSGRTGWRFVLAGTFMVLAQLAKGSAVILPLMFLICELLRRDGEGTAGRRRFAPLLPLAAVALTIFLVQFKVASHSGVVAHAENLAGGSRLGGLVRTLNTMLGTFLWPAHLSYDYDISWPAAWPPAGEWVLPILLATVLAAVAVIGRRRTLLLTLLVLVPLVPYLNIIPLGNNVLGKMVFYDHYLLHTIMLLPPLATCVLAARPSVAKRVALLAVAGTVVLSVYDRQLARHWQNRETLYQWVIDTSPRLPKGYLFLGTTYLDEGRYEEARETLQRVFSTTGWEPTFADAYQWLGDANVQLGDYQAAARAYHAYLAYSPCNTRTLQRLSETLVTLHDYGQARQIVSKWLSCRPDDPAALRARAAIPGQP